MKLSLITEVFDTPSLDGVETEHHTNLSTYRFSDKKVRARYAVIIYKHDSFGYKQDILDDTPSDEMKEMLKKYNDNVGYIAMTATVGQIMDNYDTTHLGSHNTTGLWNHYFVYGKLIASIQDAINRHDFLFLQFSGSELGMDLVYDQMIRLSNRKFPDTAFSHFKYDIYVRSDIKKLISNSSNSDNFRKEDLKAIRDTKNRNRRNNINKKQNPVDNDQLNPDRFDVFDDDNYPDDDY